MRSTAASPLADLLAGDPVTVAPRLLGMSLVAGPPGGVAGGRIVEVEAYRGEEDAASHAFRGPTARNRTMFGPPGLLYVYFTYGMHFCCNIVCWPEGRAGAVLLRALRPESGLDLMRERRTRARRDSDLCSGPGKLCQALGIDRAVDGTDLLDEGAPVRLVDDEGVVGRSAKLEDAASIVAGPRIGIAAHLLTAGELWRFSVLGDENVSRPQPSAVVSGSESPPAPAEPAEPRSTTS